MYIYTHRVARVGIFQDRGFQFELIEVAHVCYMGDGDMFKMEDVGDEKDNSWNAMCIDRFHFKLRQISKIKAADLNEKKLPTIKNRGCFSSFKDAAYGDEICLSGSGTGIYKGYVSNFSKLKLDTYLV